MKTPDFSSTSRENKISSANLIFRPLDQSDITELEEWHQDTELRKRYGESDWPNMLLKLIEKDPNRKCWIVREGDARVAYVDLEVEDRVGHIGLVVNPSLRNRGFGKRVLTAALSLLELRNVKEVHAGIEQDNVASLQCFKAVGFKQINEKPDHEGCLNFVFFTPC